MICECQEVVGSVHVACFPSGGLSVPTFLFVMLVGVDTDQIAQNLDDENGPVSRTIVSQIPTSCLERAFREVKAIGNSA